MLHKYVLLAQMCQLDLVREELILLGVHPSSHCLHGANSNPFACTDYCFVQGTALQVRNNDSLQCMTDVACYFVRNNHKVLRPFNLDWCRMLCLEMFLHSLACRHLDMLQVNDFPVQYLQELAIL